ncbi:ArnT family glycosyltransferase [Lacihabitans soyangensis]|uniref:Glycosyltransferase RgtA/B/C/D-like domain-containing protein n=1 Tax=Lacihabitans soyangensis TaxID=869394 RepID=A0AAE3KXX3_9BACT|nr:glycosyltransferase family 39 protein [Lacihabitans soyangensis]MCP9766030.1 hypothetical protein [Lacihabitans soyangensis]
MKTLVEKTLLIATFTFVVFVCFYNLNFLAVRAYDEGRNAVNAFEMYLNPTSFLYTTFDNQIDTWNTKPPLLIWLQVLFMNIFGPGEWAIRLPSALAGIGIAFMILWFVKKSIGSTWVVLTSWCLLFSNWLFTGVHVLRTGDYDATFTLFSLSFVFCFYNYSQSRHIKPLVISCIFLTLAILTKGIAAFFFLPGIFLFLILNKKLKEILLSLNFWKAIIIPLVFGVGYYLLREILTPGYIHQIWINEIAGRYTQVENHGNVKQFDYYFQLLRNSFGLKVLSLAAISIPLSFLNKKYLSFVTYLTLLTLTFFLIVSTSKTKLFWYIAPVTPLISILASMGIFLLFEITKDLVKIKLPEVIYFLAVVFLLSYPNIKSVINDRLKPRETNIQQYSLAYKLRKAQKLNKPLSEEFKYVDFDLYKPHYLFYSYLSNRKYDFSNFNETNIQSFDKIAADIPALKAYIESNFPIVKKEKFEDLIFYSIAEFSHSNDARLLRFQKHWDKNKETKQIDILRDPSDSTSYILIKNEGFKLASLSLYFRRTNPDQTFEYDVVHLSDNWDYKNHEGYDLKFIKLRNPASQLELKGLDSSGNEMWVQTKPL